MAAHTNGVVPSDVRAAAERYLSMGFIPVPVARIGNWKAPLHDGWEGLRPGLDELNSLFPPSQPLNIGLLLGQPSGGLIDIDLDAPEAIRAASSVLPPTGWISGRSRKPRSHWWYRVQNPPDKASEEFHDLDGTMLLELRSTKGQTVVPPSFHQSGEPIQWAVFDQPRPMEIAPLRSAAGMIAAVSLLSRHWPREGSRQSAYLALSGGLLRSGWEAAPVEQFVELLADLTEDEEKRKRVQIVQQTQRKREQDQKTTGWPKLETILGHEGKEIVRRVRLWLGLTREDRVSGVSGVIGVMRHARPRKIEPYQPFPVDCLPSPIAEYVRAGAAAVGCDPAYLALTALAVVAGLIGYTHALRLKRTWKEYPVVWSLLVGESGSQKSPAYHLVVDYLFTLQRRLRKQHQEDLKKFALEMEAYKEAKRAAKEEGTNPGDAPEPPPEPVLFSTDSTIEALAEIIEDNPRGLLVTCDELTAWFSMFSRYQTGKQGGSDLPRWLSMHSAGGFSYHRKTGDRRRIVVPHAAVSVSGGIQPGILGRSLTPEFLDAGLIARLLLAMPPRLPKRWSEVEIDQDLEASYRQLLDRLLELEFDELDGEKVPVTLKLSPEAKAAWVQFYNAWGKEQASAEGEMAAALSKLEAYAARFALIHHVVTCAGLEVDDRREVGLRSVEAGVTLCRWFAREAKRIYALLAESTEQQQMRRLVDFIRCRGNSITVRALMRANCRRYPDAETAEAALDALVEAELARWIESSNATQGGKAIKALELCMTHDTDDTDPQDDEDEGEEMYDTTPLSSPPASSTPRKVEADDHDATSYHPINNSDHVAGSASTLPSGVMRVMRHAEVKGQDSFLGESPREGSRVGSGVIQEPLSHSIPPDPSLSSPSRRTSATSDTRPKEDDEGPSDTRSDTRHKPPQNPSVFGRVSEVSDVCTSGSAEQEDHQPIPCNGRVSDAEGSKGTATQGGKANHWIESCMTHDTHDIAPQDDEDNGGQLHDTAPLPSRVPPSNGGMEQQASEDVTHYSTIASDDQSHGCRRDGPSSVIGVMRHAEVKNQNHLPGEPVRDKSRTGSGVIQDSESAWILIDDPANLGMAATALDNSPHVGLDLETTGLDPRTDRVRLLSLSTRTVEGGTFCYLVDCFAVDPSLLWPLLAEKELVLHNAVFDLGFLERLGFTPSGKIHDTMLLAQLLAAGTYDKVSLEACCERWLHTRLDKTEQKSNWSKELKLSQLTYAARDVQVLFPLLDILTDEIDKAGLREPARIEQRCLPAITWMSSRGVPFRRAAWDELANAAHKESDRLQQLLDQTAPARPGNLFEACWNWDSAEQVKQAFSLVGHEIESTGDDILAGVDHPLASLLREYRHAHKKVTTYGTDWLKHVADEGRIYARWRQIGAASGRMSCSTPNMQQLPRGEYRRCVEAPPGRVLVKADYSQIELRIAAKVSGDRALLEAYKRGADLHTRTARSVLGIEQVTKQDRQLSKALNFGLLYGMGAKGFQAYAKGQYGLDLSEADAARYRKNFFKSYPGLAAWHRSVGNSGHEVIETRTLSGRRRVGVKAFTEKLNTPVQGTGADGLKLALALLWERRDETDGAFPVLAVHDEIVVECDEGDAGPVAEWLKKAMIDGMAPLIAPVPVEVEVKVGKTWGGD